MAAQTNTFYIGMVSAISSTAIMVCSKSYGKNVHVSVAYLCWLTFAIGMALVVGFLAAKTGSPKFLAAEISTLIGTLYCTFLGGRFLRMSGGD